MVNTLEIQQALQDALPDRRFTVNTRLHEDELIIIINRSRRNEINYQLLSKVVENRLRDWQLEGIHKLKFYGRIHYHNQPEWQQIFEVNENSNRNKASCQSSQIEKNKMIGSIFNRNWKKVQAKVSSRLAAIKLALLGTGAFTLVDGMRLVGQDKIAGFHLLSIAAVLATGLGVVEAIDVLCQEIKCRN